jgi:hypothetical protein
MSVGAVRWVRGMYVWSLPLSLVALFALYARQRALLEVSSNYNVLIQAGTPIVAGACRC